MLIEAIVLPIDRGHRRPAHRRSGPGTDVSSTKREFESRARTYVMIRGDLENASAGASARLRWTTAGAGDAGHQPSRWSAALPRGTLATCLGRG